jgi:chitin disaccharide deacetylase
MLIINADDWGRSVAETDSALRCHNNGRLTSVSAMVFMKDSERAAELAKQNNINVGLHLNFTEGFTGSCISRSLLECHARIVSFLRRGKYSQLLYNPFLRKEFSYSYRVQAAEFERLFGEPVSRVDGHHHMHLCANLLLSETVPSGMKIRRNFSFWPGEKSWLNRTYRTLVDRWLQRRYRLPDYFFDLTQTIREEKMDRVVELANSSEVELMTHPIIRTESEYLLGDHFRTVLDRINTASCALV